MLTKVGSSIKSSSASPEGISVDGNTCGLLEGGSGEGVRGPMGRRSEEFRESERVLRAESGVTGLIGVVGLGVVER